MSASNLLGIQGLTPGGIGIWALVVLAIFATVRVWINGMADRQRAENEGERAHDKATEEARSLLFAQMQRQLEAMEAKVERLERRIVELEENERRYLAENLELRAALQVEGRVRQLAQQAVSADRIEGKS